MERPVSRAERLARIERLLFDSLGGLRAVEIARAVGVDRRTVYRDLEALSKGGIPIWRDAGRFSLERERYQMTLRLSPHEAAILFLAARLYAIHAGVHRQALAASLARLASVYPQPTARLARAWMDAAAQVADVSAGEIWEVIARAWTEYRRVRLWYRGQHHDVDIYDLAPTGMGDIYLVGLDGATGEVSTFALDGVERVQALDAHYTLPPDFDPARALASARCAASEDRMIEVALHFTPAAAPTVSARLWHPSQQVEALPDGACRVTLAVGDLQEIRRWVLSWGAEVQVLAPPALHRDIAEEAQRLAQRYE